MQKKDLSSYIKAYEPWSTLFTIEPIVVPLTPIISACKIHPNVITFASLIFGIAAGVCFALGHWIWAALAFQGTYLTDNLDGKVARYRNMTSEFGAKLDDFVDCIRKPACFLGVALYFYTSGNILFAFLTAVVLAFHVAVHRLYVLKKIDHCDLEFPEFQKNIVRKIAPRTLALYTFFEEQFFIFILFPLVAGIIGLPEGGVWFLIGAVIAICLCLLKLLIVLDHRRKGNYELVHQNWNETKGNLDEK